MSLASLEAALLQFVVDALEDCGEASPDHAIRHQGFLPNRCCTENGVLSISWEEGPGSGDCEGPLEWTFALRWVTCWPPDPSAGPGKPPSVDYAERDAVSARIHDVAECVRAALSGEICRWGQSDLRAHAVSLKLGRIVPIPPGGLCAGVLWRVVATVRRPESPPT